MDIYLCMHFHVPDDSTRNSATIEKTHTKQQHKSSHNSICWLMRLHLILYYQKKTRVAEMAEVSKW